MSEPIRGKVARVISDRQLIINRGSEHGVRDDMVFQVLNVRFDHVTDPDTNEDLGSLTFVKARVRVRQVQAKIALAETYEAAIPLGALSGVAGLFYGYPTKSFRDPSAAPGPFDEAKSVVKRGDVVEELVVPPPIRGSGGQPSPPGTK